MIEPNALIHGDCLDVMRDIPYNSVDAIICDLPYQVLHKDNPHAQWDRIIPFEPLWEQYERIIKDNGAILLFGQGMFTADIMYSNRKLWRYNLVWYKGRVTGFLNANRMPLRCHEDIVVFDKSLPAYNPQMEVGLPNHNRGNGIHKETNQCYGKYKSGRAYDYDKKIKKVEPTRPDEKFPMSIISIDKEHETTTYHPCLPAGTKVWFENKWKNIEDICIGDKNEFGSVAAKTTHYAEKMIEIIVDSESVYATWNHPFLVKRENAIFWINAEQIKKGDKVLCL